MGLTIHYKLRWKPPNSPPNDVSVLRFVEEARRRIVRLRLGQVTRLQPAASSPWTIERVILRCERIDQWTTQEHFADLRPAGGYVFTLASGEDCEPAMFGLCRYPEKTWYRGRDWPTKLAGWRLQSFAKTQYASLHGWEHFRRCHLAIIAALGIWRDLGAKVKIIDEGGYWPGRSETKLRAEVDEMNQLVAAFGGALKDAVDETDGRPVQSPIFQHGQFELLEAQGLDRHAAHIGKAVAVVKSATGR